MFEIVDGRTDNDGLTPELGYTISSPKGSGELIIIIIIIITFLKDNILGTNASLTYGPQ